MVPENLYPQIRRFERRLAHYLEENDFHVLRHFSWTDEEMEAVILIEIEKGNLSDYKKQAGPLIFSGEIENFLKKYEGNKHKPYIEKNQFFVCVKRRFLNVETAIKSFLSERRSEMPEKIAELNIRILKEKEIIRMARENKELNSYLVEKIFSV
jgi:tRNA nucleotidyltransferase (CCA-adding enzyme)